MQTESARMTTAEEARYRINYPNSSPRAVKVVALDPPSEAAVKRGAQGSPTRLPVPSPTGTCHSLSPSPSSTSGAMSARTPKLPCFTVIGLGYPNRRPGPEPTT